MNKFSVLATILMVGGARVASAQNYGAGMGFPIGEKSRIHTNLDLGVAFDSNPSRLDNQGTAPDPGTKSDWRGLIRPGLVIDVPGSSVMLNLRGQATILQYFGAGTASETTFGGDVGARLQLGGDDSFLSFKLEDTLVRTPAFLSEPGTIASDERRFREWNNRGTARITLRPGGRALEFDLGYLNEMVIYDNLPASQRHGGLFEARWKFLPKTALVFHTDISTFQPVSDPLNTTLSATPLRVTLGLVGQVTSKLSAEATVGYEDLFSEDADNSIRTVIGNGVLTYSFSEISAISAGYRRRVFPVVVLNGYTSDAPFVQAKLGIGGRLIFSLYGQYEFRSYVGDIGVQVATGDASVEYWFFEFLNASLGYRLMYQNPNQDVPMPAAGTAFLQDFSRHQVMFNIGLRY
jgi:hypothetical protein